MKTGRNYICRKDYNTFIDNMIKKEGYNMAPAYNRGKIIEELIDYYIVTQRYAAQIRSEQLEEVSTNEEI